MAVTPDGQYVYVANGRSQVTVLKASDHQVTSVIDLSASFWNWPEMPAGLQNSSKFLTRLRTVLSPDKMATDFEFRQAATDGTVSNRFEVQILKEASAAAMIGKPLFVLFVAGLYRYLYLRYHRSRPFWSGK